MKIAIHHKNLSFSRIWIQYCKENDISYKIVNCYDSDIIAQLEDCQALMWHWDLNDYKAELFVRQLTYSFEKKGIKVFPDIRTCWHYEDKVGQKYLLEALDAPHMQSFVSYSKSEALRWIETTSFPKVFKLRTGAASSNVILVKNKQKGESLIKRAFGKGFQKVSPVRRLKSRLYTLKLEKNLKSALSFLGGVGRIFIPSKIEKNSNLEKGYVYFQDFAPNNQFDIRLIVIGEKCFGMIRYVRKGDFRASGSGLNSYNHHLISTDCVTTAFETAKKIKSQSIAFDFIKNENDYKIIEMSYAFVSERFPGYWDSECVWHEGEICPQRTMIDDFLKSF